MVHVDRNGDFHDIFDVNIISLQMRMRELLFQLLGKRRLFGYSFVVDNAMSGFGNGIPI